MSKTWVPEAVGTYKNDNFLLRQPGIKMAIMGNVLRVDMPPQIFHFGILIIIKLLEKQPVQEVHTDPPLSPRKQKINLP